MTTLIRKAFLKILNMVFGISITELISKVFLKIIIPLKYQQY